MIRRPGVGRGEGEAMHVWLSDVRCYAIAYPRANRFPVDLEIDPELTSRGDMKPTRVRYWSAQNVALGQSRR
jgi:hypothetical protein